MRKKYKIIKHNDDFISSFGFIMTYLTASMMDGYMIARIFNKGTYIFQPEEPRNIIIYTGGILDFLHKMQDLK